MNSPVLTAIVHFLGVFSWLLIVIYISLKIMFRRGPFNTRIKSENKVRRSEVFFFFPGLGLTLSGLYYGYREIALQPVFLTDFWWVHSMILAFLVLAVVLFFIDPMVF